MARTARFDRQVALHRAVELFWSRGYYASSMKHIEEALDMRPGSLYATFGSKSGLFSEALDAYAARGRDEFAQIVDRAPSVIEGLQGFQRLRRLGLGAFDAELLETVGDLHLAGRLDGADVGVHRPAQVAHAGVVGRREGVSENQTDNPELGRPVHRAARVERTRGNATMGTQ